LKGSENRIQCNRGKERGDRMILEREKRERTEMKKKYHICNTYGTEKGRINICVKQLVK